MSQANQVKTSKQLAGVLGFFDSPESLIEGMKKVKAENYESIDAFTPFPVHGLEQAQGLKRSWLPFITFVAGITGCTLGFLLQYWTSAVDWPIVVGGKPFNSWPAFVPVMFEVTVLFAGISTVVGMILINRLPNVSRASFDPRLTLDRFAIIIEAPAPRDEHDEHHEIAPEITKSSNFKTFSTQSAEGTLKSAGAKDIKVVYNEGWF